MQSAVANQPRRFRLSGPLWPVVVTVIGILWMGVGSTAIYLPNAIISAALDSAYRSNLETADQIQITRGYYTKHVVAKALSSGALTPSYRHKDEPNAIPLPATFVHDISELLKQRETSLSLVSPYPWPHRAERKMDDFESTAWEAFQRDPTAVFSRQETKDGKRVLRVAVADRMAAQTCVSCHNSHPESVKRDWKVGDVRAVMEVTRVIEPYLATAEQRSSTIMWSLVAAAIVVTVILIVVSALAESRTREKQEAAKQVRFLAEHDALTELLNRPSFLHLLNAALRTRVATRERIAIHHIDLDGFDEINKKFGHSTGDELVRRVAMRLRDLAGPRDLLARIGGDEFALAQFRVRSDEDATKRAVAIIAALSVPFDLTHNQVHISASVGVTMSAREHERADVLLQGADVALYRAKTEGRNRYVLFTPDMAAELSARREIEDTVRRAARHDAFQLHFQPICSAKTRKIEGFEALLRLPNPAGGFISPAVFIPIAERIGLIAEIGAWVLKRACEVAAAWPSPLTVAVNLSSAQFKTNAVNGLRISALVRDALARSGLSPHRLELEITESLLLETTEDVIAELHCLKSVGVSLVMDDFGTGYSSLSYLWKLPLDKVKIDRSFVAAALEFPSTIYPILETITALGRTLRLKVTAEGIETDEQAQLLANLACDQMQGYFFSRPIPEAAVAAAILKDFPEHSNGVFQLVGSRRRPA